MYVCTHCTPPLSLSLSLLLLFCLLFSLESVSSPRWDLCCCCCCQVRMENMLEVMMRLKNVRNFDSRRSAQVDWAYTVVKQPNKAAKRKTRPPLQEYIRHLVLVRLTDKTVGEVAKKLLRVPWAESERYVLKCLLKVVRSRFTNIPLVSALVGGLAQVHESIGIAFVDQVLEDIRCGLESPQGGTYQARLADIRLLAELYNYSLFNSTPVFETLYLILTFGHELPPEAAVKLDAPDDYFRVRMVCCLLDTCGSYFSGGRAARKLDRFLTFFQAYLLSKQQPTPLDVEFDIQDVLHSLRPKLVRFGNYADAITAVQGILTTEAAAGGGMLGAIDEEEDEEEERERGRGRGGAGGGGEGGAGGAREQEEQQEQSVGGGSDDGIGGGSSSASGLGRDREGGEGGGGGGEADPDFEREYQQLMFEMQGLKGPSKVAPLPPPRRPPATLSAREEDSDEDDEDGGGGGGGGMAFKMLMKRGGRDDRSREIVVPASAPMVARRAQAAEAEAREREEMKRLTLAANHQQESEESASARASARPVRYGGRYAGQGSQQQRGPQLQLGQLTSLGLDPGGGGRGGGGGR
ncbi:hypothetical protein FOA52_003128 [Chlamydomonas sp. UWO 241]|nr:hypothetical protein FOA52_003128 [Chlamydomonas sp. UWO 241]